MITGIVIALLLVWLAPPVWVVRVNIKARRDYGQDASLLYAVKQWWGLLSWPLGVIEWLRGR